MSCWTKGHSTMSGKKRITVDQGAWDQAQRAAARLREVNRELPGMLDALRREQQETLDHVSARLGERQDAFDRAITGLSQQTKRIEAAASRRIRAQERELRATWDSVDQVRRDTRAALEEQGQRIQEGLARERQERVEETNALRDELAELRQDRGRALASARTLLADAAVLSEAIDQTLPHERYAPGKLTDLSRRRDMAEGNAADGLGEAALAQAQEVYLRLSELRAEVEIQDREWQAARIAAGEAMTVLEHQIRINSTPDAVDENGEKIDGVTLDVDFWSEGELTALKEEKATLAARIEDTENPPSAAELRRFAEQDAMALDERLTSIVTTAAARQMASQIRANLAELVTTVLEDTAGYTWEEGQAIYANSDERRAFYSKLRHPDDSEIVIEVAPDENGDSCVLRILSYESGLPDEEERVRRAHTVADSLRDHGIQIERPAADPGEADPALTDFARLRQPMPTRAEQETRTTSETRGTGAR